MAETQLQEQAIFEIARKIGFRDTRQSYLREACSGDTALHERLTNLLRAYDASNSFLETPPPGLDTFPRTPWDSTSLDPPIVERPGTVIGPYKLLEQIAEGGMGVVYMAEQLEPVERRVALKIIKPGMDTRHVIARFQAEWQALAMMDHPNIAKMYDAGTTGPASGCPGRPYFVMELVKGVPITEYCDQWRLSPHERLKLFILVCQAVQHAHQKGIIHRDLKPSNVLVAQYDDRPVPKIIDFGVAKATGQRLTEKTVYTHFGQIIGTAEYMSPEQAQFNQLDVDTRSDVYSLGVLLYELLSGLTPFDHERLRSAALDEMLRIVREEEPPPPSTRLSASDKLASIAANRQLEPEKLGRLVRGELDWIVMKALDKDRTRRYQSASSFAADVQNYLHNDPVQACPPSSGYRFRKFARRHKAVLFSTSLIAAALLLGIVVSTWQAIRATRESSAKAAALAEKDAALATAREAVDQMLFRVGSDRLDNVPLAHPLRQSLLNDALQFYEALLLQSEGDPTLHDQSADVLNAMGGIQRELGRYDDARRSFAREIELLRNLANLQPDEPLYAEKLAAAEEDLAYTLQITPPGPNSDEVDAHYRQALAIYSELERRWPGRPQSVTLCLRHLAETASARGEHTEAERLWWEAIERGEAYLQREPTDLDARSQVCWACVDLWQAIDASPENRISELAQVIKTGSRYAAILLNQNPRAAFVRDVVTSVNLRLAMTDCRQGRVDEAIALFQETVREIDSLCADCPWNRQYWATARYMHSEAIRSLNAAGCREDAIVLARQMYDWVQITAPRLPEDLQPRVELLECQTHIAECLQSLGQRAEAAELAQAAEDLFREFEARKTDTAEDRAVVAQARLLFPVELQPPTRAAQAASERLLPALEELKSNPTAFEAAAHQLIERAYRARENGNLTAALSLSSAVAEAARDAAPLLECRIEGLDEAMHNQWRLDQLNQAEATSRELLALTKQTEADHWVETSVYARLAEISLARGRFEEAEAYARRSVELIDRVGHRNTSPSFVQALLARALQGQGRDADALAVFERAWKLADADNTRDEAGLAYYEWLAAARASKDSRLVEGTARSALDCLNSRGETVLDGLHTCWRAMALRELGEPESAARDWDLAFARGIGDVRAHSLLALALLHAGDEPGYRRVCKRLVEDLGATRDENGRFRLAWTCGYGDAPVDHLNIPLELAAKLVEEKPTNAAYLCAHGALLYRAGQYREAIARLQQATDACLADSSDQVSPVYSKYLTALALWKLGDASEAKALLGELQLHYDSVINASRVWNRRATLELFHREAEAQISPVTSKSQGNLLAETGRDDSNHSESYQRATQDYPKPELEERFK